jgi:hypothetical protein
LYHYYTQIDINTFQPTDWYKLEDILAVVPVIGNGSAFGINEILQKEAFDVCHNSPKDKNSFPKDLSSISPFAMYTFDAVWAFIQELNKSSFDKNSPSMEKSPHCFDSLLKITANIICIWKILVFWGCQELSNFQKIFQLIVSMVSFMVYTMCNGCCKEAA